MRHSIILMNLFFLHIKLDTPSNGLPFQPDD